MDPAMDPAMTETIQPWPSFLEVAKHKRVRVFAAIMIVSLLFYHFGFVARAPAKPAGGPHLESSCTETDWSRFAYVQYVTNSAYLCNSVMLFEILHRLGSKADRLMMYPNHIRPDDSSNSTESQLLRKARDEYGVNLQPIEVQRGGGTWVESYTKLLAINQTQYDRVLSLDSDSTILQTMDELFLLPAAPVAMPRAYWLENNSLNSQLVLIQPSTMEFQRAVERIKSSGPNDYDMEIFNNLYGKSAFVLPHRPYTLLTGELRGDKHENYLGNDVEVWDPDRAVNETRYLHFSDWPVPKPWLRMGESIRNEKQPRCAQDPTTGKDTNCRARDLWLGFYEDFSRRRKIICDIEV